MASSRATTVDAYLRELPPERRAVIAKVRSAVKRRMPEGYREGMQYGMISYSVPETKLADTYNGQRLCYIALAAQKRYNALYLIGPYADAAQRAALVRGFAAAGKKLDMGRSCLRFRSLDDLALEAIGEVVSSMTVDDLVSRYHASRGRTAAAKRAKASAKAVTRASTRTPRSRKRV